MLLLKEIAWPQLVLEVVQSQTGSWPFHLDQLTGTGQRYIGAAEIIATKADIGDERVRQWNKIGEFALR